MPEQKVVFSCSFSSDDSSVFDPFPSPPSSHKFTSPPPIGCQDTPDELVSSRPTLPPELIEHIIGLFYQRYHTFRALRAVSLASSQLRVIAIRRYMISLDIYSARQLVSLLKMHMSMSSRSGVATRKRVGFNWVKSLTAQCGALANALWRPSILSGLRSLRISFAAEVKSTQKTRLMQIFGVPLINSPMTHLTSLALTGLWRIDVFLLNLVSRSFPGLISLHLSCSEHLDVSCCWACFEDSSSSVTHSPIPNHFPTVASLTNEFAKALKPLTELTDLHLGIFLSDEQMLENHIDHYDNLRAYSRVLCTSPGQNRGLAHTGTVLSQTEAPSSADLEPVSYREDEEDPDDWTTAGSKSLDELLPFPHGPELCPICLISVSIPDARTRELEASLTLAQKLRSLTTIGWSSFFAWTLPCADENRIGDWQRATKTYVLRRGGRVRVRRRPWDLVGSPYKHCPQN